MSAQPVNSSIRGVRIADVPNLGKGSLGSMELAGTVKTPAKVQTGPVFPPKPITGLGPLAMNVEAQQKTNAIRFDANDYAASREETFNNLTKK